MNREFEGILCAQTDLYGRISRAYENLKKTGSAKLTLGTVEARLQSLEANWSKFESHHERLLLVREAIAEHEYVRQNVPALAEEIFLQQKGMFLDMIRSLKAQESSAAAAADHDTAASKPRTTLPRIQLPHFLGKYEDWPSFRDLFQSIIGRDSSTTQVEKLHYLRTCLKGEADLLIRNLTTTDENYERAWKILSAYYENKRLLTRAYLASFTSLTKMKSESAGELCKIFHGIKATVSSLAGIGRAIDRSEDLFVYLSVELLDPRSRREWETFISDTTEPPSYATLEQFLDRRLHTLDSMPPVKADIAAGKSGNQATKSTRAHLARKQEEKAEPSQKRCFLCQKDHILMFCEGYKKKTAQERKQIIEEKGLCQNCLGQHKVSDCVSKKTCSACSARHHTSIHDACRETVAATTSNVAKSFVPERSVAVLLATARVRVTDRYGNLHNARGLVDQGSESSLISERLVQRLKLSRSSVSVSVYGIDGQKSCVARGRVALSLLPRAGGLVLPISALVLPRLTAYTGGFEAGAKTWPHLRDLELADPDFCARDPVDILLGADVYAVILGEGLRKGGRFKPVAQNTALGWILSGPMGEVAPEHVARTYQCRVEENLSAMVRRFWEQEEVPSPAVASSQEERECEDNFVRTHSRKPDGRYVVCLPLASPLPDLSSTRRLAVRVQRHMEGKFVRDTSFHALYRDFMRQYAELGHMTPGLPVADPAKKPVCFLLHHGVMRPTSSTTKLRVVFNGSTTGPAGRTLNEHLQIGPNLLPALADVLLRWRWHRYELATDIEKMYRQIDVHPQDRDLQRILWRDNPEEEIQEFRLNTVTYGLSCAPFLAIRTLHHLADDEGQRLPLGAAVLRRDVYMDDILTGAGTIPEIKAIQKQLVQICMAGGFPLKKWSANESSLLQEVPAEDRLNREPRGWQPGEGHLTLGLRWLPHEDHFAYSTELLRIETITKRTVLSLAARLFDPLGWLSPTTARAKIWIQVTWLLSIDWDTTLPGDDVRRWRGLESELPLLEAIRVPRWFASGPNRRQREIHGFADASERAFAAVVYLRTRELDGEVEVRLISAKTKVAPLKQVTLPRLELCAATLLVRLVAHIRRVLEAEDAPLHLWSDSTVVLGWICGHPTSWTTYVANRVSEIQTSLPDAAWHHVPEKDNPADCASRGISPAELVVHPLWWQGPEWLQAEPGRWATPWSRDGDCNLP